MTAVADKLSGISDKMRQDAEINASLVMDAANAAYADAVMGEDPTLDPLACAIRAAFGVVAARWRERGENLVSTRRQGAKSRNEQLSFAATIAELAADDLATWRAAADLAGVAQQVKAWRGPDEGDIKLPPPPPPPDEVSVTVPEQFSPSSLLPVGYSLSGPGAFNCPRGHSHPTADDAIQRECITLDDALTINAGADCSCHGLNVHQRGTVGCLKGEGFAVRAADAAHTRLAGAPECVCPRGERGYCELLNCQGGADLPSEIKIIEVSMVTDPPNPHATITSVDMADRALDAMTAVVPPVARPEMVTAAPPAFHPGPSVEPSPLRFAPGAPLPEHLSHSAMDTAAGCGMKVRLLRVENRQADERPSMALVGGSAMDELANEVARIAMEAHNEPLAATDALKDYNAAQCFKDILAAEVAKREAASTAWPLESWHFSNKGKEDLAWWRENGAKWAQNYVPWHLDRLRNGWKCIAVQAEFLATIEGVPVKGFIDQVWHHEVEGYEVVDVKSGSSTPTADQLELYGLVLPEIHQPGWPEIYDSTQVKGRYYDARKAELGKVHNIHPTIVRDAVEYRVASRAAERANWHATGLFPANTNAPFGGCGSCSIKRACPVGSKR